MLWLAPEARAWTLPEHIRIGAAGVRTLGPEERATLERYWSLLREAPARRGGEVQLCAHPGDEETAQESSEKCIDPEDEADGSKPLPLRVPCFSMATLPALAADHSCSAWDLEVVMRSHWVHDVLRESRCFGRKLERRTNADDRIDARRGLDVILGGVDGAYLSRAKENGSHFQRTRGLSMQVPACNGEDQAGCLAREQTQDLQEFLVEASTTGRGINANALYINFHVSALKHARAVGVACSGGPSARCATTAWQALRAEAFAQHFLQDSFSTGHTVGQWGSAAVRFGTHDFYSRHGVELTTWRGERYVAHGDVFMTEVDIRFTSRASAASLAQVLRLMNPGGGTAETAPAEELSHQPTDDALDVCQGELVPIDLTSAAASELVIQAMRGWPQPSLRSPDMTRFSAELGPYYGIGASAGGGGLGRSGSGALARYGMTVGFVGGYALDAPSARDMNAKLMVEASVAAERSNHGTHFGFGGQAFIPMAWFPTDGWIALLAMNGSPIGNEAAMQIARGSAYGIHHAYWFRGYRLQVEVLRGFGAWYFPGEGRKGSGKLALPLAALTFPRRYAEGISGELALRLGAQAILQDGKDAYGGYLDLVTHARFFP